MKVICKLEGSQKTGKELNNIVKYRKNNSKYIFYATWTLEDLYSFPLLKKNKFNHIGTVHISLGSFTELQIVPSL